MRLLYFKPKSERRWQIGRDTVFCLWQQYEPGPDGLPVSGRRGCRECPAGRLPPCFCSQNPESGVATILPEKGSHVDGVLWKITGACEKSLNRYEGYPYLYGKKTIHVRAEDGTAYKCMVYVMNAPHKDYPARPSDFICMESWRV